MSVAAIRSALQNRLNAMTPALITAWENVVFAPPSVTVPYQKAFVLFAKPDNLEQGGGYDEQGYMQVTLMYPQNEGSINAAARAMAIRAQFPKKLSLTHTGVVTVIWNTPEIGNGVPDGDRWSQIVRIPFRAQIY